MKKPLLVCVFTFLIFFSYGQTIFTYGTHPVSVTEFLNAYNKNKVDTASNPGAMRSYLGLYIKFKLKVQAAKDMKLDTLPSLVADLHNFRDQIQSNYLIDKKELSKLDKEAFIRSQKDIHAVYYFLPKANNVDSLKEIKEINELTTSLKSNKPDEEIIAKINAKNSANIQKVDLGYITVFNLPYKFENVVYGLKPGQISTAAATKKGWYIFKNAGERKAVGTITIAQILFAVPQGAADEIKEHAKRLADSIYNALEKGADFATLAKNFSDDRATFMNGGLMPEFGTAKYDSIFEDHAFALEKDGEISKPFETQFGYHIIKRISAQPIPESSDNETFMYHLKQEVLKDSRAQIAKEKFDKEIISLIGLKTNIVNKEKLWDVTDSFLLRNKTASAGAVNASTVLFSFNNNQKVKVSDWLQYLKNENPGHEANREEYPSLFSRFLNKSADANYASRLEKFNPAFKAQVDEFKEGNMLFEIMQRKVWGKASADTAGLKEFYNAHKEKYLWTRSAEAIIFSCSDKTVADNCIEKLKKGWDLKEIINENPSKIQADSGRFELGQIPVVGRTAFSTGLITLPVINKNDGTAVFAKIIKLYPDNQQRSFEDARGLVINDYQNYLEEKWVAQLKRKYPVKVNQKVLQDLLKKN